MNISIPTYLPDQKSASFNKTVNSESVININPNVLSGTPVFNNTRVPVETLFDHLERGISIAEFLQDYPSVTEDQVAAILELAGRI